MAGQFIHFQLQEGRAPRTVEIRRRMQAPLPGSVTDGMADTMRTGGPGSVADQFARQTEQAMRVGQRWPRTRDFGSRKAPARTLHDKGALEAAWTGRGAGSRTRRLPNGVEIGVDTRLFPQAAMFQRGGITIIRVTPRARLYLGLTFGVWLRKSTRSLKVEGRPVGVNTAMLGRVKKVVGRYYLHGEAVAQRRAA